MNKKRTFVALFLILFLSHSFVYAETTFMVGITEFYPPFVMKSADNHAYGFDISLMKRICAKLKINCQYKPMPFEDIIPAIENESIDFAISSLVITKTRKQHLLFSIPYLQSHGSFLTRSDKDYSVITKKLLEKKTVGIQSGAAYVSYMDSLKIKDPKYVYFNTRMDQIKALMDNKIDIIVIDHASALYWIEKTQNAIRIVGKPFPIGEGLGIAVANKRAEFLPLINQVIIELFNEKIIKALHERYF